MQSSITKELQAALSLASYFAKERGKDKVDPIDLLLALLSLDVFIESITSSEDVEDDDENISDMLGCDGCSFFTTPEIARKLLDAQGVPQPDNSTIREVLLLQSPSAEEAMLPLSDGTQHIIDCTSCMVDAITESQIAYLSILSMATAGSGDSDINGLLNSGKVTFEKLEEVFFSAMLLVGVSPNVGSCIIQALSNNDLENSINGILAALSGEHAEDFLAALFNLLVLGHKNGENCKRAPIKINRAYSTVLTIWIEDSSLAEFITKRINEVTGGESLLKERRVTGVFNRVLTEVINAIAFPLKT